MGRSECGYTCTTVLAEAQCFFILNYQPPTLFFAPIFLFKRLLFSNPFPRIASATRQTLGGIQSLDAMEPTQSRTTAPSTAKSTAFPFLRIPAEFRNEVYDYVCDQSHDSSNLSLRDRPDLLLYTPNYVPPLDTSILRVNRQIHPEVWVFLLNHRVVTLHDASYLRSVVLSLGPVLCSNVTKLELLNVQIRAGDLRRASSSERYGVYPDGLVWACAKCSNYFCGLKHLDIEIAAPEDDDHYWQSIANSEPPHTVERVTQDFMHSPKISGHMRFRDLHHSMGFQSICSDAIAVR